jgi:hypothetical protein
MAAAAACAVLVAATVHGEDGEAGAAPEADFWEFPSGSTAWMACDAPAFGGTLRGDAAAGAVRAEFGRLLGGVLGDGDTGDLIAAICGHAGAAGVPWRVCVMDFGASWAPDGPVLERLAAVVEVRDASNEASLSAILGSIDGERVEVDAGSGRRVTVVRRGAEWRQVSWFRDGRMLVVGFGDGSLRRWFESDGGPAGAWRSHRAAAGAEHTSRRVLEAFLDANALRRAMPERFTETAVGRRLAALGLANARGAMLMAQLIPPDEVTVTDGTGYSGPPLLVSELSWSARSEPPSMVHATRLSTNVWPHEAGGPPRGAWAMAWRSDWRGWSGCVWGVYSGWGDDVDRPLRESRRKRWFRENGPALDRLIAGSDPWLMVWGGDGAGRFEARVPVRGDVPASRVDADATAVFRTISDAVGFDAGARSWEVRVDAGSGPGVRVRWRCTESGPGREWSAQVEAVK